VPRASSSHDVRSHDISSGIPHRNHERGILRASKAPANSGRVQEKRSRRRDRPITVPSGGVSLTRFTTPPYARCPTRNCLDSIA